MKLKLASIALCVSAGMLMNPVSAEPTTTLHERLTLEDGMSLVGDGLYAKHFASGASFVATNAAGRLALADKVRAKRVALAKRQAGKKLSRNAQLRLQRFDAIIDDLSRPTGLSKISDDAWGGCGNGSGTHVHAKSDDGQSAIAYAALELDFGPTTQTENLVTGGTDYQYDWSVTYAYDPASISLFSRLSCDADAYASVSCPDGFPGIAVFVTSTSTLPRCDGGPL